MARLLPAQERRVESGSVQFGDDWPGVFIRGDNALYYALNLRSALPQITDPLTVLQLDGLARLLESADARRQSEGTDHG